MLKLFGAVMAVAISTGALAQSGPVGGSGRYVIVHSPHLQSDTVLLDTATGKTWALTKDSSRVGDPIAWDPMARTDNPTEMRDFFIAHPDKPR